MKIEIAHEDLSKGLSAIGRIVPNRGQLPILAHVLLEGELGGLTLSATNLEIGMRLFIPAKISDPGAITVPAKSFAEYISSLPVGVVSLESGGEKLKVGMGRFEATFAGIAASEFPVIPKLEKDRDKKLARFKKNIIQEIASQVAYSAASDESRPVLTGVQFKCGKNGMNVTATDGFRLSRKIVDGVSVQGIDENGLILPAKTILELSRIVGDGRKEEVEMQGVEGNSQVIFGYDQAQLVSRVLEGNFPDVDKIVPVDFKTNVIVEREELLRAVRAVAIFARDNNNVVRFKAIDNNLTLSAIAQQSGESEVGVEADVVGEEGEIVFNFRYILDYLGSLTDERIRLCMNGNLAPGIWKKEKSEDLVHIIMPVRV